MEPTNPPAPTNAPPTPTLAAAPIAAPSTGYISNPLALIVPSWQALKLNLGSLVMAFLFPIAIGLAVLILSLASIALGPLAIILSAVVVLIGIFITLFRVVAPIIILTLASAKGQKMSFKEAYNAGKKFGLRLLGLGILAGLAILGGFILLIIPGLIFIAWFSLAQFVMVEEDLGIVDSMKRSKAMVKGHVIEMLGLLGLGTAAGVLNIIPIIGPIAGLVLGIVLIPAIAIRYVQLKTLVATGAPAPKLHPANYIVIVVAIIALAIGGTRHPAASPTPTPAPQVLQYGQ